MCEGGSRDAAGFRERGDVDGEGCSGEDLEGGVRGFLERMSVWQQSDGNNQVATI